MKYLYLIRHAKSSWDDHNLKDFDRPLNERGLNDAPLMGNVLRSTGIKVNKIISSPAKRAIDTAHIVAEKVAYPPGEILEDPNIYHSGLPELMKMICGFNEKWESVFFIGHNPGFTQLAEVLTSENFGNIPTCGIVGIELPIDRWMETSRGIGVNIFYDYPKKHY